MGRKLSFHVQALSGAAASSIRKQENCDGIIKFMTSGWNPEIAREWKQKNPRGKVCLRHHIPHNDPMSVSERVRQLLQHAEGSRDIISYVESPWNEEYQSVPNGLEKYTQDTIVAVDMIKQQWPEVKISTGHFSVGNPVDIRRDWAAFAPALEVSDALSLHEYGSPFVHSEHKDPAGNNRPMIEDGYPGGWWNLRYRLVYQFLQEQGYPTPNLIISECGRDHGLTTGTPRGYKFDMGYGANDIDNYANEMRWYLRELARDFYVIGATVFLTGCYNDWASFDVAGVEQFDKLMNEDISAPLHRSSILAPHKPTRPDLARGGIVSPQQPSTQPAPAPAPGRKNLYEDWVTTPGNMNPKTGPEGLSAFQGHMEALVKIDALDPHHTAFELGFPRFEQVQAAPASTNDPNSGTGPLTNPPSPSQTGGSRDESIAQMAELLQVDEKLLNAIVKVESAGNAFVNGKVILRFEPHIFLRQVDQLDSSLVERVKVQFRGTDSWRPEGHEVLNLGAWLKVHANQSSEWMAYGLAARVHEEAAARSCSTGKYQIMGWHFGRLGYDNAKQMIDSFNVAEVNQDWGFVSFVLSDDNLLRAMKSLDLRTFVRIYNGSGNVDHYMSLLSRYGVV